MRYSIKDYDTECLTALRWCSYLLGQGVLQCTSLQCNFRHLKSVRWHNWLPFLLCFKWKQLMHQVMLVLTPELWVACPVVCQTAEQSRVFQQEQGQVNNTQSSTQSSTPVCFVNWECCHSESTQNPFWDDRAQAHRSCHKGHVWLKIKKVTIWCFRCV